MAPLCCEHSLLLPELEPVVHLPRSHQRVGKKIPYRPGAGLSKNLTADWHYSRLLGGVEKDMSREQWVFFFRRDFNIQNTGFKLKRKQI